MRKNYCDRCGQELKGHNGKFLAFVKSYDVFYFHWNIVTKEKSCYECEELCKDCWNKFMKLYDNFLKNKEIKENDIDSQKQNTRS